MDKHEEKRKRKKIEQRVTLLNSVTVMRHAHGQFGVIGGKSARDGKMCKRAKLRKRAKHAQEPRAAQRAQAA